MRDVWQSRTSYEAFIGGWSRAVARQFVAQLGVPSASRWLDVGCGSGALTAAILDQSTPSSILALDRSLDFVAGDRREYGDAGVKFLTGDAASLPFPSAAVDAAVSGLVLNFVPDPQCAVREMLRVVRPRGVAAVYVWDYAEGMQSLRFFWDAAIAIDPRAAELDEGKRFPICNPAALGPLFRDAGASDVSVSSITIPMRFQNFEDLWQPFLGGQGPAPTYVASMPVEKREALRDELRGRVPSDSDGSIHLSARAWYATGGVP